MTSKKPAAGNATARQSQSTLKRVSVHTPDLVQANIDAIAGLYPNVMTEALSEDGTITRAIDFDLLRQELSDHIVEGPRERYQLDWPGKRAAMLAANAPTTSTLRPMREESVDFDTTKNLFIEGDNLEALKLLQESYLGKVKLIYIDPPYNTGNDFLYEDDFAEESLEFLLKSGQVADDGARWVTNLESSGRLHSVWLANVFPRLKLARNLLADDGLIFISIGRDEQANLRRMCDEVFGERNLIEVLIWNKRVPKNDERIGSIHEYVLIYARNAAAVQPLTMAKDGIADVHEVVARAKSQGKSLVDTEDELRVLYKKNGYDRGITLYNSLTDDYQLFGKVNMSWPNANTVGPRYKVLHPKSGLPVRIPDRGWRWKYETFLEASGFDVAQSQYQSVVQLHDGSFLCGRLWFADTHEQQPSSVIYLSEVERFLFRSIVSLKSDGGVEVESLFGGKSLFPYPKPTNLLRLIVQAHASAHDGIVLDFYAGSGSTAHAVLAANADDGGQRRFILVQSDPPVDSSSEIARAGYTSIADFSRERIRRAAASVAAEYGASAQKLDTGFRGFRIDSGSFVDVLQTPDDVKQTALGVLTDNVKADRSAEDLLFQVLIDWGLDLSASITVEMIDGSETLDVDDGALIACFADSLSPALIKVIAERKPLRAVFRDASFASDAERINLEQIFREISRDTEIRVL